MSSHRSSSHSVYEIQVHLVWCTKYRYHVLKDEVQLRCRDLIKQSCNSMDINILKGVVSSKQRPYPFTYKLSSKVID